MMKSNMPPASEPIMTGGGIRWTDVAIVFLTFGLVIFSAAQWKTLHRQANQLESGFNAEIAAQKERNKETERALAIAETHAQAALDQAEASLLSAKNLLRSVRPFCVLQDIWLQPFSGEVPNIELPDGYYLKSVHGMIKNKGTGTAFAREIQLASCADGAIGAPLEPEGKSTSVFGYYELKPDEVYEPLVPLYPIPITQEAENGAASLFVWGWLRYADIHGIVRRSGFAFQWWTLEGLSKIPGTFIPCGPASYWYDVEEEPET
jgi:hypothetical protein